MFRYQVWDGAEGLVLETADNRGGKNLAFDQFFRMIEVEIDAAVVLIHPRWGVEGSQQTVVLAPVSRCAQALRG